MVELPQQKTVTWSSLWLLPIFAGTSSKMTRSSNGKEFGLALKMAFAAAAILDRSNIQFFPPKKIRENLVLIRKKSGTAKCLRKTHTAESSLTFLRLLSIGQSQACPPMCIIKPHRKCLH
jgi:hypothetical protein